MRWLKDPSRDNEDKIPLSYRIARRFYRFLTNIWFREINIVDDENLPPEGGILFITWHPSGLIDPMLMTASLPGKLTTIAKHTLFKIPLLGRLLRASGVVPVERPGDSKDKQAARARNAKMLANMSHQIAHGGRVLIFPEGATHAESNVRRVRSGAARILLHARREAIEKELPEPQVVPIGLHYSESHTFRERAAVVIERVMELNPIPPTVGDSFEQDRTDRIWIEGVTQAIDVELRRANLSKTTWRERTMIWKGRSLAYAEKKRIEGERLVKPSYAESVLGARRLRAGWEYMMTQRPEETQQLAEDCEQHFEALTRRGISPYDVDSRPETFSFFGYLKVLAIWLWALVWMFGLVTWSAIAGNYPPYKGNGLLSWVMKKQKIDTSVIGTIKVLSAVVFFPMWWMVASAIMTWSLLSTASPINSFLISHWLLEYITYLPALGIFLVFLLWWPLSARLHLKLYARLVRSSRDLKRWKIWKDQDTNWDELVQVQRELASRLVQIGAGLVLPGDPDWTDPPSGHDDVVSVCLRSGESAKVLNSNAQGFE
ncbi:MAG: hypothetical protein CMA10_03035 [Euryarchaeota archaeon]|nr:hypothetical protein [Euryarchaeota archaeon]